MNVYVNQKLTIVSNDTSLDKFIESLPEEIAKHYDMVELMKMLSEDEKQMILPFKVEVK